MNYNDKRILKDSALREVQQHFADMIAQAITSEERLPGDFTTRLFIESVVKYNNYEEE